MKNMITIVVIDPTSLPCVVAGLKSVSLHVEVSTWCGKSGPLPKGGILQVPEGRVCPKCESALAAYGKAAGT